MAKEKTPKVNKPDGRVKQLIRVFKLTIQRDRAALWYTLAAFFAPIVAGTVAGVFLGGGNALTTGLWIFTGLLAGVLVALIVLSRRAERTAYSQIEGQPGAVGAVLKTALKRGWSGSEMPVAMNPRTQEAIYRAVGPAGVVLIGEGTRSRVQVLLEDERRKVNRVAQGAPVHFIYVCGDEQSTPLAKLSSTMLRFKRSLNKSEVSAVSARLRTVGLKLPIPKGMDPSRARAQRR